MRWELQAKIKVMFRIILHLLLQTDLLNSSLFGEKGPLSARFESRRTLLLLTNGAIFENGNCLTKGQVLELLIPILLWPILRSRIYHPMAPNGIHWLTRFYNPSIVVSL